MSQYPTNRKTIFQDLDGDSVAKLCYLQRLHKGNLCNIYVSEA